MASLSRDEIRTIVVAGFAISALAGVIAFTNDLTAQGAQYSFHGVLDILVYPLSTIAAACAWSLLTGLSPRDDAQTRTLRRAYLFFAAQYLLFAVEYNFVFTPPRSFGGLWTTAALWFDFVGALLSSLGLFLMYRLLGARSEPERVEVD